MIKSAHKKSGRYVIDYDAPKKFRTKGFGTAFLYKNDEDVGKIGMGILVKESDTLERPIDKVLALTAIGEYRHEETYWPIFPVDATNNETRFTRMLIHSSYLETA